MQEPHKTSIAFDDTELTTQLAELTDLLKSRFPQGIPDAISSEISRLSLDVIFGDNSTAVGADGTIEVLYRLRFGSSFESFRAALLAGKLEVHTNEPPIVELARQAAQAYHDFVESELRSLRGLFSPSVRDTSRGVLPEEQGQNRRKR